MSVYSNATASEFDELLQPDTSKPIKIAYGTVSSISGGTYILLDGAEEATKAICLMKTHRGDRVKVEIQDHALVVVGNVSRPATDDEVANNAQIAADNAIASYEEVSADLAKIDDLIATKVDAEYLVGKYATIESLNAQSALIEELTATKADVGELNAIIADVDELEANKAEISELEALELTVNGKATITDLEAETARIDQLETDFANIDTIVSNKLTTVEADIEELETTKLSTEQANLLYANIDFANIGDAAIENFFSKSGMISDLIVSEGTVTGKLVGVTIVGDLIEGGTIKADKLVVQGEDGLYYKLNVSGESVAASQTEYNSLNGSIITANTITAEKINVDDLVAFDATIGGFNIGTSSIYSGAKSSAANTTRGVYLDDTGQVSFGDDTNYLKYFKDADGTYKLVIAANSMLLGASGQDVVSAIEAVQEASEQAQDTANSNAARIENAEASLEILNTSISSLVVDENGSSLMEQTSDGWVFNIGSLQQAVSDAANSIDDLEGNIAQTNQIVNNTNSLVNDIAEKTAYITMATDDSGSPCLELGKQGNPFKLRITNTSIDFMQGTERIAYITNRQLYIQSSVVTDEMKIGASSGFIWKKRSNGNMGLRWEANN